MPDISTIIKSRRLRDCIMYGLIFVPEKAYIRLFNRAVVGKWPNLRNPQGYTWKRVHISYTWKMEKI